WRLRLGNAPSMPIAELAEQPHRPVRLGDVQALVNLHAYFKRWETKGLGYLPPEVVGSQSVQIRSADNLILLGTSRDWDGLYEKNWESFPLGLMDRNLIEWFGDRGDPTQPFLLGPESPDFGKPLNCCGVLVSRTQDHAKGCCITIINGTHPVGVRAICELLTD